jgi:16S rRNA (guanine527-N7)-methyltransferase
MDVVTARALAPLSDLMAWSRPFWGQNTVGLFLKGQDSAQELLELQLTAPQDFENINIRRWPSRSDARGVVLELARRA